PCRARIPRVGNQECAVALVQFAEPFRFLTLHRHLVSSGRARFHSRPLPACGLAASGPGSSGGGATTAPTSFRPSSRTASPSSGGSRTSNANGRSEERRVGQG